MADIRSIIVRAVAEACSVNAETLRDNEYLSDLGCDSLDLVDIVRTVENETGVEVSTKLLARIKTVGDAIKVIESLQDKESYGCRL